MPSPFERLRVLIIDDNHHMISIVRTILTGFGVKQFLEARDAADAFDIVKSEAIDLIIVDYLMDFLDGTDFVRLVRTGDDSPNPYIPIIMLTAYSERSRVISARDVGVTEFCCKPVTAVELYRKLSTCILRPRPFVRTSGYFGPCRRRRKDGNFSGEERRSDQNGETELVENTTRSQ